MTSSVVLGTTRVRQRFRRVLPMTTCEALTPRATSRMASAGSSPVTVCQEPPSSSVRRRRMARLGSGGPLSPSARATWTASSSPPAPREAIRAPRRSRVSPSGPPDRATTTRSRVGHEESMPWSARYRLQPLVDPVGEPEQGELPQRREVADPEVVRQGGVDLLGLVDVAVGHPAAQRLRRHVDQLDLLGAAHHLVGHRLALHHPGDRLDDVVERLEVLDVDRRDDVDPGIQQLVDVLPALLVAASPARWCGRARRRARPSGWRASSASRSISSKVVPR